MTREVLKDLLDVVEAAIQAGDWKVDGACDPDLVIRRAKQALAQPEQEPVISKWVLREVYFDEDGEPIMHRSTPQPERHELQAKGEHPAPCARHCEANAFKIVIKNLKAQLAQPEQEPLEYWNAVEGWVKIDEVREHFDSVGCGTIYKSAGEGRAPLYTTPPQRKPLTLNWAPIQEFWRNNSNIDWDELESAITEAAHDIKENT